MMLHATLLAALDLEYGGAFKVVTAIADAPVGELLSGISECRCTPEQFVEESKRISRADAQALLAAAFRGSMAYSSEKYMSLERANELASQYVSSFGADGEFYSPTCVPEHPEDGISGWYFLVSANTFEVALYAKGPNGCAMFLVVEED